MFHCVSFLSRWYITSRMPTSCWANDVSIYDNLTKVSDIYGYSSISFCFWFSETWTGCQPLLEYYWSLALYGCPDLVIILLVMYHLDRKETQSNIIKIFVKLIKVKVTKKKLTIFEIFLCYCSSLDCSWTVQSFMTMPDQYRSDMALMRFLFLSRLVAIIVEVSASRAWIMASLSLQSLLSCLLSAFISNIFVMRVSWFFWITRIFLLRSDIDIESKRSGGGGGVRAEFGLLLVRAGTGAALLGIPGGGTGDFSFLPFCVLANLPLVLVGMGIYLGLGVEELFASFSIPIGAAISA